MSDDESTPVSPDATPVDETRVDETTDAPNAPGDATPAEEEARIEAFDLDHDGKVSYVEGARAQLGVVDARLEEVAKEGGIMGKAAETAHHLLDKLDND
jgi:hypothetical protein